MSERDVITKLNEYTTKKYVTLFSRCNAAILASLKTAKALGFENVFIPDVAGWLTYEPYSKKAKLIAHKIITNHGVIDSQTLNLPPKSVLIYHALAGYHTLQDSKKIVEKAKKQDAIVIEDVCGSFSLPTFGDIVVASFGKGKPVNFGTGGFAATNDEKIHAELQKQQESLDYDMKALLVHLNDVPSRVKYLKTLTQSTKSDLQKIGFNPVADKDALVVIVPYTTDEEKSRIETFCKEKELEIENCPRYIRSDKKAISIEVKRK
ncbi:MAG TPA: hypothetical protein VK158_01960 [Acidobacteriota bacterium]|nr:hypothetical protein [Acidobacteriota bacterium]